MTPTRPDLDRDVIDLDPEDDIRTAALVKRPQLIEDPFEHFDKLVQRSDQLAKRCIVVTKPQDWLVMGEKLYLQATGTERLQMYLQLVMESPGVEREDYPDGTFAYVVRGRMASRLFGIIVAVDGGRWSGDEFFDQFTERRPDRYFKAVGDEPAFTQGEKLKWRMEHRLPVDPIEVRKAAHTNWKNRGVSMIAGLRGLTIKDLAAAGFDTSSIQAISYDSGGKGGKATGGTARAPAAFGPAEARGKPVTELTDAHLAFYATNAQKNLNDPNNRYHDRERAWLDKVTAEQDRRKTSAGKKEPPADPDGSYPG